LVEQWTENPRVGGSSCSSNFNVVLPTIVCERTRIRSFGFGFAVETAEISGADKPLGQYGWGGYANTEFRVIPDAGVSMVFMRQTVTSTHRMSKKLFGILRSGITIK
jgi:CubicO group peptidase (beta-lactamase class C family)